MGFFIRKRGVKRYETGELLFCRQAQGKQMIDRISELTGIEAEPAGNMLTFKKKGVELSFAAFGTEDEGEAGVYAKRELNGVCGYFRQVEAKSEDIQRNLLYMLKQCQGVVRVNYSFEQKGERANREKTAIADRLIGEILRGIGGMLTRGGEAIVGTNGRVILDGSGSSEVKTYLPPLEEITGEQKKGIPREALERRKGSVMNLRRHQIYTPLWLPVIETEREAEKRTKRQVCGRAVALLTVALYSECLLGEQMEVGKARRFVQENMEHFRVEEFLSPAERQYLYDDFSEEAVRIHFSWQYENLYVMEWALGLFDRLDWPNHICDVETCVRKIREFDSFEEFVKASSLRSHKELLSAADFIYRLHWACVDARINGFSSPGGADNEVVMERHRSLFWAAGCKGAEDGKQELLVSDKSCGWDKVNLST